MKTLSVIGITLLVFLGSLYLMAKMAAGNGIQLHQMDQPGKPRIEWVMQMEEEEEDESLINYCEYFAEEMLENENSESRS